MHPDEYSSDESETPIHGTPDPTQHRHGPSCYICGYEFGAYGWINNDRKLAAIRDNARLVGAEELESLDVFQRKAWWNLYRAKWNRNHWVDRNAVLYNQKARTCHISGVASCWGKPDCVVPLNEGDGYAGSLVKRSQVKHIVAAKFPNPPRKKPSAEWEWVGYHVHARCWELLSYHELGDVAERDLEGVLAALRGRRREKHQVLQLGRPGCSEDPVRTRCVSDAIGLALQQADKRRDKEQRRSADRKRVRRVDPEVPETRISLLPMELLHLVVGYLPVNSVVNVEKALGIQFDDTVWRLKIPTKTFHEIDDIAHEEYIDWKRLCLKLERRLGESSALATRKYLLNCLDDILGFVKL